MNKDLNMSVQNAPNNVGQTSSLTSPHMTKMIPKAETIEKSFGRLVCPS